MTRTSVLTNHKGDVRKSTSATTITGRNDFGADDSLYTLFTADHQSASQTMLEQAERELIRVVGLMAQIRSE